MAKRAIEKSLTLVFRLRRTPKAIANQDHQATKRRHANQENPTQGKHQHETKLRLFDPPCKLFVTFT
jgi:hypothetical protein